jgi:hypothetical protein
MVNILDDFDLSGNVSVTERNVLVGFRQVPAHHVNAHRLCLGGWRPGDLSQSFKCAAVSSCPALHISLPRAMPGGVPSGSLRKRAASSAGPLLER